MWRRLLPGLALLLGLAGCSGGSIDGLTERLLAQTRLALTAAQRPADAYNQLLVTGLDGNLFLVDAASGQRFALTTDASRQRQYLQPVWAPDGEQIAWARLEGGRRSAVEVSRFDGSDRRAVPVPFPPFYFSWSPTGEQLAYLSNWMRPGALSMALRVVEVGEPSGTARTVAEGQPFYFSWAPDGQRLLAHIDNQRVELLALEGESQPLLAGGGQFAAPQWAPDGERLIYATQGERQRLIVADLAGEELVELTDYPGRITFTLSPDGSRLAYVVTEQETQMSTLGSLYAVELESLRTREVSESPVLGFYWSPNGTQLAYLAVEAIDGELGLRWHVWDGRRSEPYAWFLPSRTYFENYLPFFDQYAQSHRIWAADSSAFVFVGTVPGEGSGIWVQQLGGERTLLGTGMTAAWSPAEATVSPE